MNTALRKGELLALSWSDISLDAKMLTDGNEHDKSGKQRHAWLNAVASAAPTQWVSQAGDSDEVIGVASVKSGKQSPLTAAKIENFRFHDLLHHSANRQVMAGIDLNRVRELLGYADLMMIPRMRIWRRSPSLRQWRHWRDSICHRPRQFGRPVWRWASLLLPSGVCVRASIVPRLINPLV